MRKLGIIIIFGLFAAAAAQEKLLTVITEDSKITLEMENAPILGLEWPEAIGASSGEAELAISKALVFPVKGRPKYGRLSVNQVGWFLNYLAT